MIISHGCFLSEIIGPIDKKVISRRLPVVIDIDD
jgi:hypothetical protein